MENTDGSKAEWFITSLPASMDFFIVQIFTASESRQDIREVSPIPTLSSGMLPAERENTMSLGKCRCAHFHVTEGNKIYEEPNW